ncbi:hypothetical protein MASS_1822 [Mycobacteroides abscessus subsp. bolletii 50594]|uniref:Uncharacterized protein n=1 Tax=Mycobacteroides abscessus subsp. bolletii 50594 TaxID=1303024 RepID=A0AB33A9S8_9MYCO|nr:hypothetical protein MASS_1822 [Mycobacteroides abscessus subsp. bolletii 50594]
MNWSSCRRPETTPARSIPFVSIWRRIDGKHTGVGRDEPAAECGTEVAEAAAPGPIYIWDGATPENRTGGFAVDEYHPGSAVTGHIVIEAAAKPPFGEWEQLSEWPA